MNEGDAARAVKLARHILESLKAYNLGAYVHWIALAFIAGGFAISGSYVSGGAGALMRWTGAILGSTTLITVFGLLVYREFGKSSHSDRTRLGPSTTDRGLAARPAELIDQPPSRVTDQSP